MPASTDAAYAIDITPFPVTREFPTGPTESEAISRGKVVFGQPYLQTLVAGDARGQPEDPDIHEPHSVFDTSVFQNVVPTLAL